MYFMCLYVMPICLFIGIVHCICNSPVCGGNKEYLLTYLLTYLLSQVQCVSPIINGFVCKQYHVIVSSVIYFLSSTGDLCPRHTKANLQTRFKSNSKGHNIFIDFDVFSCLQEKFSCLSWSILYIKHTL